MRCRTCSYSLWNLAAGACPECGSSFKPSDFDFVPHSVMFCCPKCNQSYFGSDSRGHLVPPSFQCVSCQSPVVMDEMILRAAPGVGEFGGQIDAVPWEDRVRFPWYEGFATTVWWSLSKPSRLGAAIGVRASLRSAIVFDTVMMLVYSVAGIGVYALLGFLFGLSQQKTPFSLMRMLTAFSTGFVILAIASIVFSVLALLVWSALAHLIVKVSGGSNKGFSTTLACLCYAGGCRIFGWIPCLGQYLLTIGVLWQFVSATLMMRRAHGISTGRAAASVLAAPLLGLGLIAAGIIFLFSGLSTAVRAIPSLPQVPSAPAEFAFQEAKDVSTALKEWRESRGVWPSHAIQLVDGSGMLGPEDLFLGPSSTEDNRVAVANRPLTMFNILSKKDQAMVLNRMIADQASSPWDSYRLADYLFCFEGVDPNARPEGWVAVVWPREAREMFAGGVVITASGLVEKIDAQVWPEALSQENQARAAQGLSPLPDLHSPLQIEKRPEADDTIDEESLSEEAETQPGSSPPASPDDPG